MKNFKAQYHRVKDKGTLLINIADRAERSPHTVRLWFSDARFTSDFPEDPEIQNIIKEELKKAPKK